MIVSKVSRGSSFKGLAAYLGGQDKGEHRAVWSATQNIGTENIYMAARLMAATAMDADEIKRQNGWDGRGRRTTEKPVYHTVMSWPKEESPDYAHQEQAARDLVKAAGFENAQAIFVGHDDNGKTHVHVVVNVLDPETGKQFSLSNDYRKMQAWALEYCKEHGIDPTEIAPNRLKNAEARAKAKEEGRSVKPEELEGNTRLSRSEWKKMRAELLRRQGSERDALKKKQAEDWGFAKAQLAAQRKADKKVFLTEHTHQKQIARERNRPVWRDLFERQRQEAAACRIEVEKAVKDYRKAHSFLGRVLSILPFRQSAAEAQAKLTIKRMELGQLLADQELEKRRLRRQLAEQVFDRTVEALPERRPLDLSGMKERHAEDWQALREQQREEREAAGIRSERLAREKAEHEKERTRDRRASIKEREAKMREGLSEEARRELEEQRKQREREKDRDRERDR